MVTSYISNCISDIVPTKTVWIYPNQKPWINREVRYVLRARAAAFASGNTDDYKKARYDLRRSIKEAKRQNKQKLEGHFANTDSQCMGLRQITDYQNRNREELTVRTTLPDELSDFYARFEALNMESQSYGLKVGDKQDPPFTVSSAEVTSQAAYSELAPQY